MLEKLGYLSALIALVLYIAPAFWGPQFLQKYPVEIGRVILIFISVIVGAILLWPRFKKIGLHFRKFIFRLFVNDMKEDIKDFINILANEMEPEIRQIITRLKPQNMLNYELTGPILKKEGYRHISARVETIQLLLEGIINDDSDKLRDVGRKVGNNFVQTTWPDMSEFMSKQRGDVTGISSISGNSQSDKLNRICTWANMEITAGWGEFEPDLKFIGDSIFGIIKIRECFLAVGRDDKKTCLCPFLEGYLESMLSGLLASNVKVIEHICGRSGGVDKTCIFKVDSTK